MTGGTVQDRRVVTPRSRGMRIRVRSNVSDSTTAKSSSAKKPTEATQPSTRSGLSGEIPVSPRVDIGPKAYKVYRDRTRKVIRFYVARMPKRYSGPWFVYDMDTSRVAGKTSKTGYSEKKEAVRVARNYRDTYGAYCRVEF